MNWWAKKGSGNQGVVSEDGGTGRTVAVAYDAKDAVLIAAAPDLLAALVLCVQDYEDNGGLLKEGTPSHIMAARAAIDKAINGA